MPDPDPIAEVRPPAEPPVERAVAFGSAKAVARVAAAIAGEPDAGRVPQRIVDGCVETLGASSAHLLAHEGRGMLRLVAYRNLEPPATERLSRVSSDEPLLVAEAARTRELQLAADLSHDGLNAAASGVGSGALFAAPLVAFGRLQGVLGLTRGPGPATEEERETVAAVAELFAIGLANARSREGRRGQRVQLEALRRAALAIAEAADLPAVLQSIVEQARLVANAEYAALGIVAGPDRPFEPWVFSGLGPDAERRIGPHPRPRGLLGAVPAEGRSIRIADLSRDPRFEGFPAGHPQMRAFLGVPIRYGDEIVGNLYLTNKLGAQAFTAEDQHAIEILGRHAGIAVQQVRTRERIEREVDERRRSEAALRRSEARLARAQQIAHLGSWEWDLETGATAWSAEMYSILGHRPGAFPPSIDAYLAAVAPTEREQVRAALDTMARTGEPVRYQTRIVRPDGTERVVRTDGGVIPAEDSRRRAIGTMQDVTGRVRAEEERGRLLALARERSWLRTVIERSPVGILLYEGVDGTRLVANHRAEELYGGPVPLPRDGTMVRPDRTPVAPAEFPSSRALAGKAVNGEEFVLLRSDGVELPIMVSAAPILDGAETVVGAVVTIEDISPLKELARMREEWTSVVAHDLRQPVTTISAYGALLARHADPTVRTRAGHVLAAAKRLDRMIADLLDFSRLEAHRMALDLQPVALSPLLREVAERSAVETGAGRIRVEIPDDLPPVRADPARLEQVLANLLSNAVKYGFADTPIRLWARVADGCVEIAVENRGPGLAAADLPKLFQRFQRGRRVARVTGIGLGLYIARGIVEAHGGRIRAESVPGETTTFRFTVPLAEGDRSLPAP